MNRRSLLLSLLGSSVAVAGCKTAAPAPKAAVPGPFGHWPAGSSPQQIGKRLAENFLAHDYYFNTQVTYKSRYLIYPETFTWYGSLELAKLTGDTALRDQLIRKFDFFLTPEGAERIRQEAHVDYRQFGTLPLEIYLLTRDRKYLQQGLFYADAQWNRTTPDGITTEARYWSDDLYMLPIVQTQAFRATGDRKYIERAALTLSVYLDKLQQPNGLFLHAPDSPFYWARGNGWVAAGMAEVLNDLPKDSPHHARILRGYTLMMASLLKYQSPEGLWRQLIDQPDFWLETSGTGMFAFGMVTGVKQGWLDGAVYGPAARKAWLGLLTYLQPDANIREVVIGTNKAAKEVGPDLAVQRQFYYDRPRRVGDLHGQAPLLWTAAALLR